MMDLHIDPDCSKASFFMLRDSSNTPMFYVYQTTDPEEISVRIGGNKQTWDYIAYHKRDDPLWPYLQDVAGDHPEYWPVLFDVLQDDPRTSAAMQRLFEWVGAPVAPASTMWRRSR